MNCILIVEDEPFIALDLQFACEDAGISSIMADSSGAALAVLAANDAIDGAVLDVNLGNGETCEAIAEALRHRGVPFVLNTGDLNRAGEFLRKIEAPILSKPTAANEVVDRLLRHGRGAA